MAVRKYLKNNAGTITEETPAITSAGAADEGKITALDASGRLSTTFMPVGVAIETQALVASEALAAGDWVNLWDDAGAFKCRKADATTAGKEAHGFVLAAVAAAATATVFLEGTNTALTGQTPGVKFLSITAGAGSATAPTAAGNVVQRLGVATSATTVNFEPSLPYVLA